MGANVLVDAGFMVALFSRRDTHNAWAVAQAKRYPPPWKTCEAALSEAFHLLGRRGAPVLRSLIRRNALVVAFEFGDNVQAVLGVMEKYADVPAGLADSALVRMTETMDDPLILTTDNDFRVYRRHGRQIVPCVTPS